MSRVARYDGLGFVEDLPSFNIERWDHGCGTYMNEDGTQVRSWESGNFIINTLKILIAGAVSGGRL